VHNSVYCGPSRVFPVPPSRPQQEGAFSDPSPVPRVMIEGALTLSTLQSHRVLNFFLSTRLPNPRTADASSQCFKLEV